jgi:hypothetical protein
MQEFNKVETDSEIKLIKQTVDSGEFPKAHDLMRIWTAEALLHKFIHIRTNDPSELSQNETDYAYCAETETLLSVVINKLADVEDYYALFGSSDNAAGYRKKITKLKSDFHEALEKQQEI